MMGHMNAWKKLSSQYAHENPWYKVRHDTVLRPDGKQGDFYVIESRDAAFAVAITDDNKIMLVKVDRYTTGLENWEIPGGGRDKNEAPLIAAQREFYEETGYEARQWLDLGTVEIANGTSDIRGEIFLAEYLYRGQGQGHSQEVDGITKCQAFSEQEILKIIGRGEIRDSVTLAGLLKYFVWRDRVQASEGLAATQDTI